MIIPTLKDYNYAVQLSAKFALQTCNASLANVILLVQAGQAW